jgi:hypothetical protein
VLRKSHFQETVIDPPKRKSVSVFARKGKFFCFIPNMVYRSEKQDLEAKPLVIDADVADDEIGDAVVSALNSSRFVTPRDFESIDDFRNAFGHCTSPEPRFNWVELVKERYGWTSDRTVSGSLWHLNIARSEGEIVFKPCHKDGRGWIGSRHAIRIPESSPSHDIGKTFLGCLDQCTH